MAKTRMNSGHRELLFSFAESKIDKNVDRKVELKLYGKILTMTNNLLRKKYPESDMEVLRKWGLARVDYCLKFSFPSGRVDGFSFNKQDGYPKDIPNSRGCGNWEVFIANEELEKTINEHTKLSSENKEARFRKITDVRSLINYAKYIEDVLEVIKVPKELEQKLLAKSTSLVALSSDVIKRIQADFNS